MLTMLEIGSCRVRAGRRGLWSSFPSGSRVGPDRPALDELSARGIAVLTADFVIDRPQRAPNPVRAQLTRRAAVQNDGSGTGQIAGGRPNARTDWLERSLRDESWLAPTTGVVDGLPRSRGMGTGSRRAMPEPPKLPPNQESTSRRGSDDTRSTRRRWPRAGTRAERSVGIWKYSEANKPRRGVSDRESVEKQLAETLQRLLVASGARPCPAAPGRLDLEQELGCHVPGDDTDSAALEASSCRREVLQPRKASLCGVA